MPWPFSRSEPAPADAGPADAGGRRNESRDPATELRVRTRHRLIGAAVLLLAAVIALPMLLDTAPRPVREDVVITVASPPPATATKAQASNPPVDDEKLAEPAPIRTETESAEPPLAQAAGPAPAASTSPPTSAPDAAPPAQPQSPTAAGKEKFVVQVVALSSSSAAGDLKARLVRGGFSAYVEAVSTASGTLHRVRVGPFASRDEAQRAAERLRAAGHKATVVAG